MSPGTTHVPATATAETLSAALPPLAALGTAPGCARTFVASTLSLWGMDSLIDAAQLVISELVTNAVAASPPPTVCAAVVGVRLAADAACLLIEVWDQAPGAPVIRQDAGLSETGRGLALVAAITADWGWRFAPGSGHTKCVWAVLTLPAGPGAGAA
jgi:anti-sigma regulatory factor (Ser/Thr protein kinase)